MFRQEQHLSNIKYAITKFITWETSTDQMTNVGCYNRKIRKNYNCSKRLHLWFLFLTAA